jgi:Arginase family
MKLFFASFVFVIAQALRSGAHQQSPFTGGSHDSSETSWSEKYGAHYDLPFTGPLSFAHLPYVRCLEDASPAFDIALLGMPFDTSVTYRPGARFGPTGIRIGSRRIGYRLSWSLSWRLDPYRQGLEIFDCGDVSVAPTTSIYLLLFSEKLMAPWLLQGPSQLVQQRTGARPDGSCVLHAPAARCSTP